MADYDLAIIGGGLNGVSIARDAAGRGLRVILLEQGDLGAGASSASPRLIHGDLAGLERRRFLRVHRALAERDIWLRIAPHLVRPMRFAIPAHSDERPAWQLRSWLLLYDRLASRNGLPASATVDVTHHPVGNALKRPFGTAFEYSDCVVDDSRLVILNAVDAAARGAVIRTGARCTRAERGATWRLVMIDRGHRQVVTARALVNATGAWTASVAETVLRQPPPNAAIVQMSQIVVRRLFDSDNVYVFQNSDGRLIFASPYERDFTLIGTVGRAFRGDPAIVATSAGDVAYLCDAANRYFRERIEAVDVVRTVSGVNMAMGPASQRSPRDGAMTFDHGRGKAPLITIFGGDVTTSRRRAEKAVSKLTPFYPMSARWTARTPLPGGDFAWGRFENEVDAARERWRFLGEEQARRLVAAYGTNVKTILGEAKDRADLGPSFGPELTGAEVRYLMAQEWARFPDDILWRRTKLGLTMPPGDREALAAFMAKAT
ncbi:MULTISPECIES: glycerol-3-phosphate dehydrogenase [Bradyrhizobium]|jgi:glycerol-3-phosphate dehydrogenase|uniref:Glycerol-3-phosphate dehydrogenase n=2 Tax=Bradyrhizobium TaxID=374 RepID=A0ABY0PY71_9BRAD|nr:MULTISPECIES: glycerol-3-phosphate dehydrogenase [Bradyrhizobium]SDJ13995.1 glycerol-3-phosphate dehydrogenase [Bradyrhizobium ottawaense]SEC88982.1 glycerol-3-phosphate dehydrogenase [Bradyrhizobium lablabi]SHK97528.1 glycerol-3-phosphate dehydrogenase [Bradyrhizobium lablabi]